jgi:hypothetical protein
MESRAYLGPVRRDRPTRYCTYRRSELERWSSSELVVDCVHIEPNTSGICLTSMGTDAAERLGCLFPDKKLQNKLEMVNVQRRKVWHSNRAF